MERESTDELISSCTGRQKTLLLSWRVFLVFLWVEQLTHIVSNKEIRETLLGG